MGIGFTGTPIEKADANTQETFGGYVSIYDIEDAKEDKAVGPNRWGSPLVLADARNAGHGGPAQVWLEISSNKLRCFSVSYSEPRLFL